jgi:hypothetical protein
MATFVTIVGVAAILLLAMLFLMTANARVDQSGVAVQETPSVVVQSTEPLPIPIYYPGRPY